MLLTREPESISPDRVGTQIRHHKRLYMARQRRYPFLSLRKAGGQQRARDGHPSPLSRCSAKLWVSSLGIPSQEFGDREEMADWSLFRCPWGRSEGPRSCHCQGPSFFCSVALGFRLIFYRSFMRFSVRIGALSGAKSMMNVLFY